MLAEQLLGTLQSLVEILAEAADDRLLECLIYGNAQLLATLHSVAANGPAVVVQSVCTIAELLHANGIQVARNRLEERTFTLAVGALNSAERNAILLEGVVDMESRMLDVKKRYGFYRQDKWDTNMWLKSYFEEKTGKNIYEIVK